MPIPIEQVIGLVNQNPSPFSSPQIAREKALTRYVQDNARSLSHDFRPSVLPKYDWYTKALQAGADTASLNMQSALNTAKNASVPFDGGGGGGGGNSSLGAILRALAQQESGGNFGAVNKDSGALGAYQVMPSNLSGPGGWDMEALGYNVSPEQFLNNQRLQQQIVRHKFNQYMQQHGLRGALSAWYSGDPNLWNSRDPQGNYPSIHSYVMQVLGLLGR